MASTAASAAASFDDYLARGFTVMRATSVAGQFTGCVKGKSLRFVDGSRFLCGRTQPGLGSAARVYILRHDTDAPSIVLIDGRPFAGALSRLGTIQYTTPVIIAADDAPDRPNEAVDADRIGPLERVQSINALTAQSSMRLNDVQVNIPRIAGPKRPGIEQ